MILVLLDIFGFKVLCYLIVFGYSDFLEGYVEVLLDNVCVLKENFLLGEGRGFEIV